MKMNLSRFCWKTTKAYLKNLKTSSVRNFERKLEKIGCPKKQSKETHPPSWADLRCDPNLIIKIHR